MSLLQLHCRTIYISCEANAKILYFMGFKNGYGRFHCAKHYCQANTYANVSIDGEISCLTLGHVVMLKVRGKQEDAKQMARLLPATSDKLSGDDFKDALEVGSRIVGLVDNLGLHQNLTERGIGKDQIPIIVERATGGLKEGLMYDDVTRLVEGSY